MVGIWGGKSVRILDLKLVQTNFRTAVSNLGCSWVAHQCNIVISRCKQAIPLEFANFVMVKTPHCNVERPLGVLKEQIGCDIRDP